MHELELGAHFLEIVEALVRILAHGALDDDGQLGRDRRIDLGRSRRLFRSQLLEQLHRILAEERRA